jgi:hypothetical protein
MRSCLVLALVLAAGCRSAPDDRIAAPADPAPHGPDAAQEHVVLLDPAAPHASAGDARTVVDLPWGSGERAAGRVDGDESASMGPMSFALGPSGDVVLLDQVNARVLVFSRDGTLREAVPIPSTTFDDVLVGPGGEIVLLDRLVRSSVVVVDSSGVRAEVPVVGPGIGRGGEVTAMLGADDGVWLEWRHTSVVHVLDAGLSPCGREVLPGRKAHGARLVASLEGRSGARIRLEEPTGTREVVLEVGDRVERLVWAGTDGAGRVHAFMHVMAFDDDEPSRLDHEYVLGVRLDADLELDALLVSPYVIGTWEQFKEIEVADDGTVYQMAVDASGVRIVAWRLP